MAKSLRVLTIFLGKPDIFPEDLISRDKSPESTTLKVGQIQSTLYSDAPPARPPKWVSFFEGRATAATDMLRTESASALLVVPMHNRVFALSFGYGRHLLNPLATETSFGLRATLNSVDDDRIRSIDKKAFEGIGTHTREQASKDTSIADFGLDVERDILRAVVGTPTDDSLGSRLAGMDALTATCHLELDELPEILQSYLAQSELDDYKKRFPWIDNILEVRDKGRRAELDSALITRLRQGKLTNIWLAVPEIIEWNDIAGFSYSLAKSADVFPDLHLKDYLQTVQPTSLNMGHLERPVVGWRATSEAIFAKWPVYKCLNAEIEENGSTYLLNGGAWYRLDADFVKLVGDAISKIPASTLVAPEYQHDEDEATYNQRLANSIHGSCCLDRQLVQYGGGKSKIEFCDVYSGNREMVHMKRYGGSSVLSHLFAQGTVSGTAFISDERFRREVNKLLPKGLKLKNPAKKPTASEYEIAFFIASRSTGSLSLPFFSRVTARNAHTQLTNYGFRTTLTKVQVTG